MKPTELGKKRFILKDIFGESTEPKPCTVIKTEFYGYNLPSGGWGLFPGMGDREPAKFYVVRWRGKKKLRAVNVANVIQILDGWEG